MKYPMPPPELAFAYAVSVSDLRPWEWRACAADDYYLITTLRAEFEAARKDARAQLGGPIEQ